MTSIDFGYQVRYHTLVGSNNTRNPEMKVAAWELATPKRPVDPPNPGRNWRTTPMIAATRTIGDVINAIVAAGIEPIDGSVDETGLTVIADGRPVRIAFLTEPNRYDVDQLDAFSAAADEYDRRARS